MATIIVSTVKVNGSWINVVDSNGREISVGTEDRTSKAPINQSLKAALNAVAQGGTVEMEVREWTDKEGKVKYFGNEAKSGGSKFGGAKTFAPADKSFQAGIAAAQAVATLYAGKELTPETLKQLSSHLGVFHKFIMGTVTPKDATAAA